MWTSVGLIETTLPFDSIVLADRLESLSVVLLNGIEISSLPRARALLKIRTIS
jgi:hypothetical protein